MTPEQEKCENFLHVPLSNKCEHGGYNFGCALCLDAIVENARTEERQRMITTLETVVPRGEHTPDIVNDWIIPELKRRLTPDTNQTEVEEDTPYNREALLDCLIDNKCGGLTARDLVVWGNTQYEKGQQSLTGV